MILHVSTTPLPYEEWSSLTTTIKKPQINPIDTASKAGGTNLDTNKFTQGRRHNYDKGRPDEDGRTRIDAKRPQPNIICPSPLDMNRPTALPTGTQLTLLQLLPHREG